MAKSFWNVVKDEQYRKKTGIDRREREQDREEERIRDEKLREVFGEDYPGQYKGGR